MSEVVDLPLAEIKGIEFNIRTRVDAIKLGELKESILNHGLIHPIVVRPIEGGYEVVAGMRRAIACEQLGQKTIRAEVRELSDDEAEYVKLSENVHREDVTPLDQARFFHYLKERFGLIDEQIAQKINKSRAYVTQRLLALRWPDSLREDTELGEVEFSTAMQIARLKDTEKIDFYRYHTKNQKASTALVKYWVDQELSSLPPSETGGASESVSPPISFDPPPVLCIGCDKPAPRGAPWLYRPLCMECIEMLRAVSQEIEKMEDKEG